MSYSPMYVGNLSPALNVLLLDDSGNSLISGLTAGAISMVMFNSQGVQKACSGTWTIDNASIGAAHYQWVATDTNTAGRWYLRITIQQANGPQTLDAGVLDILP